VLAGGEDISSCLLQPINKAEATVIKNSNVFIPLFPFKLLRILRLPHLVCKLFLGQSSEPIIAASVIPLMNKNSQALGLNPPPLRSYPVISSYAWNFLSAF
jgi:hypothetical protein